MAQIDSRLGDMIRSYREKLGLTQEEMAERAHCNYGIHRDLYHSCVHSRYFD